MTLGVVCVYGCAGRQKNGGMNNAIVIRYASQHGDYRWTPVDIREAHGKFAMSVDESCSSRARHTKGVSKRERPAAKEGRGRNRDKASNMRHQPKGTSTTKSDAGASKDG